MKTNEENKENTTKQSSTIPQNLPKKKYSPFIKSLKKLEFLANLKLTKKYNCTKKSYEKSIICNLLSNANCHLVAVFKEKMLSDYIDEFLRREYLLTESRERIPKFSVYYKNYLLFFCKPTFNNFCINDIITDYGEKKAEIYYKNNYQGGKSQNEEDNGFEESDSEDESEKDSQYDPKKNTKLFDSSIKQSIDDVTIMTTINNSKYSTINLNLDNEKVEVFSENKCEVSNDTTVRDLMDVVKNGKNIIVNQNKNEKNKNLNLKKNKESFKDNKENNKETIKDNKENNQETMNNFDGAKKNDDNKSKKSGSKGKKRKKINNARNIIEFKKAMLSKGIHAYRNSNKSIKKYLDKNTNNMDINKKILESNKLTIDKLNKLLKKTSTNFNNNYNKSRNKNYYKSLNFYGNGFFNTGIISTDSNNFINTSNNITNKFNIYSHKNLKFTHTQDGLTNKKSKKKIYNNFSANLKNYSISKEKEHERNISSHTNLINNSNNNYNNNQCSIKNSFGSIIGNNINQNKNSRSRNNKGFLYKQNTAGGVGRFSSKGYGHNIYNTTSLHKIYKNNNIITNMKYPLNNIAYFGNYVFKTLNFMQNVANTHNNHKRNNTNLTKGNEDNKIFGKYSNVSQDNHRSSLKVLTSELGNLKHTKPVIKAQNEKLINVNKKSPEIKCNNNDNHIILGGWHKITKSSNNIKNNVGINSYNNLKKKKNNKNSKFRHQHYNKIVNNINTNDSSNKNHFTESHGDLTKSPLSLLLEGNSTFSNINKKNASNSKNQKRAKSNKCVGNNSHHKNKRRHNTNYNININNQININTNSNSGYNTGAKSLKDYLNNKIKHQEVGVRQGINYINVGGGFYISGCNANYNLNLHNLNNMIKNKKLKGKNLNSKLKSGQNNNNDNIIKSYHTKSVSSLTDLANHNKNITSIYKNINKSMPTEQK